MIEKVTPISKPMIFFGSILILTLLVYFSRMRTKENRRELEVEKGRETEGIRGRAERRSCYAQEFKLQLLTRCSLLVLLQELRTRLIESLVRFMQQPLKSSHRDLRRTLRKDREKYVKCIETIVEEEKNEYNKVINDLLMEKKIDREHFDRAIERYGTDNEVEQVLKIEVLGENSGENVNESIAKEILMFEASRNKPSMTANELYILEDDVYEKWSLELSDVHAFCRSHKSLQKFYLQLLSLR
jgi:hypothetical protein